MKKVLKLARDATLTAVNIAVTYDEKSLRDPIIDVTPASVKGDEPQVVATKKGEQTIVVRIPPELHKTDRDDRAALLKERLWQFRRPFQGALDRLYLGEDLVGW